MLKKTKKSIRRLGAVAMALAMAASVMTVSAFATTAAGNAAKTVTFTKVVTTDGNTCAPNTTFTYTVANGTAGTFTAPGTTSAVTTYAGKGGVTLSDTAFAPTEATAASYTTDGSINVAAGTFTAPGVYHYIVTEVNGGYEGINYDTTARDLYVYVVNSDSGLVVDGVVMVKSGATAKSSQFTNDYGKDNDTTHDITITKTVTGSQGDKNKLFDFAVSVNGATGEKYKMVVTVDGQATTSYLTSGADAVTVQLADSDSIHIYGLTANDTYTVNESSYTADGYTTTNQNNTGKVTADATTKTVTNTKDVNTPTGVIMTVAPYVLMVALAGGIAFFFLRRKHAE